MIFKNKNGQFLILSALLLLSLLLITYSLETENSYISATGGHFILQNVKFETCAVARGSNGSLIDTRFSDLETYVWSFCSGVQDNFCNLTISKLSSAPSNLSLLNYTSYNYTLNYSWSNFKFDGNFTC